METALLLGLSAALAWGLASYLSAVAARQFGGWITNLGAQLAMVAVLLPVGLVALQGRPAEPSPLDVVVLAAVGIGSLLLDVALYQLLTVAPVAILFPILAANGAVVAALAVWFLGESLSSSQVAGVVAVTAGVLAIAYRRPGMAREPVTLAEETSVGGLVFVAEPGRSSAPIPSQAAVRVIAITIAITLVSGALLFVVALYTRRLGWYQPLIIDRLAQSALVLGLLAMGFPAHRDLAGHGRRWWAVLVGIGILNAAAVAAYWLGIATSSAAVTATVASMYAAVPVLLGILLLGERPQGHQLAGIAAALGGVVLLGAG